MCLPVVLSIYSSILFVRHMPTWLRRCYKSRALYGCHVSICLVPSQRRIRLDKHTRSFSYCYVNRAQRLLWAQACARARARLDGRVLRVPRTVSGGREEQAVVIVVFQAIENEFIHSETMQFLEWHLHRYGRSMTLYYAVLSYAILDYTRLYTIYYILYTNCILYNTILIILYVEWHLHRYGRSMTPSNCIDCFRAPLCGAPSW